MKLWVKNFQSIEELEIDAGPLVLIKGPTNTGKSALHRAIRFLIEGGRRNFESMLRRGATFMEIGFEKDGHRFVLRRSVEGENSLEVDGKKYTKIGTERPPELASLGYRGMEVNKTLILPQFATQHGRYFLVGEEADSVARAEALASLSSKHLKGVVTASRLAVAQEKNLRQEAKFAQEEAALLKDKLRGYEVLDQVGVGILGISAQKAINQGIERRITVIRSRRELRVKKEGEIIRGKELGKLVVPTRIEEGKVERLGMLNTWKMRRDRISRVLKGWKEKGRLEIPVILVAEKTEKLQSFARAKKRLDLIIQMKIRIPVVPVFLDGEKKAEKLRGLKEKKEVNIKVRKGAAEEIEKLEIEIRVLEEARKKAQEENPQCPVCGKGW